MKILLFALLLLFPLITQAKPYKLRIDDFNNQKTYIGKKFADGGTAAGARMFGGQDGKLWPSFIIPGEDFEVPKDPDLLSLLEIDSFDSGFYSIMGQYYTKKINSINKKESLIIKINKEYNKFDLTYFDRHAEANSQYGGWVSKFGYMVPKSILEKITDKNNKVLIRVKGDAKDFTVKVKPKKLKKLKEFLKAIEKSVN